AAALVLSAVFNRSRLFFVLLTLILAEGVLMGISPSMSDNRRRIIFDAVALLLPLNLTITTAMRDRGIVSPSGRRRLAWIVGQAVVVLVLLWPQQSSVRAFLEYPMVSPELLRWARIPQPALVAFLAAGLVMTVSLVRHYRAVESSLLWTLVTAFIILQASGTGYRAVTYFAATGLILLVAILETSYRMAYYDELTQLPSRRALNEALLKLEDSYAIAMLDVDHFKKFNDSYGHVAGDQALRMVAAKLAHVAGGGKAYRYGGEEFAVVFPGKAVDDAFTYLDRIRRLIEQTTFVVRGVDRRKRKATFWASGKKHTNVTVSIGLAALNGGKASPEAVLKAADSALYRAKEKGRNCTVVASGRKETLPTKMPAGMRIISVS
ncbi:MAG TPA: GGDEF domain-containing protein, partial [Alphaproteobacteria bacterium]|nr:GGDEF domain-containing protein [Alphaproteobacteria bacterium]